MTNESTKTATTTALGGRVDSVVMFLDTLPDIDEYKWMEGDKHFVSQEWLCGTFAGRGFEGDSHRNCVEKMIDYLDAHIGHESIVGNCVTKSGWPDLESVKRYLIAEVYSEADSDDET